MDLSANALQNLWGAFRFLPVALGLLIAGCFFQGCAPREVPANLVIVNGNEPESLDPAIVTGVSEMRITKALFEGLMKIDGKTGRPVPGLAETWEMEPGGKTYTFLLRSNLAWSTGEPLVAGDVVYSWLRALSPLTAGDYAGQLFYIRNAEAFYSGRITDPSQVGIHALDHRRVRVDLEYPVAFFLDLCCFPTLGVVPRSAIEKLGDRWLSARPLPCSGPYELAAWRLNDKVRIHRNPHHYAASETRSEVVDFLPVGSPITALNLYQTGVADIVWDKDLVPTELMDALKGRADVHTDPLLGTCFYRFNVKRKPFDNPDVRKAFALATDRELLVRKLTLAGETAAYSIVPEKVADYAPPKGLRFDPETARRLLAAAGYPEGRGFPTVEYSFFSAASGGAKTQGKIAVELQQMWRQHLGVTVQLRQVERKIFFSQQSRLDFDISASSWVGDYNDPNTFLDLFISNGGNNRTGWASQEYDRLIRDANKEPDRKARSGMFQEAESLLIEEQVPVVPLYFFSGFSLYDPQRIRGLFPNVLDEHPVEAIWKEK